MSETDYEPSKRMQKKIKSNKLLVGFLILTTITSSALCYKFWHQSNLQHNSKNFQAKFNIDNTVLSQIDNKSYKLIAKYYDSNFDMNWERAEFYFNGEGPISTQYDTNEDGYFEKCTIHSLDSKLIGNYLDLNDDMLYDQQTMVLESFDTLVLTDEDYNLYYNFELREYSGN